MAFNMADCRKDDQGRAMVIDHGAGAGVIIAQHNGEYWVDFGGTRKCLTRTGAQFSAVPVAPVVEPLALGCAMWRLDAIGQPGVYDVNDRLLAFIKKHEIRFVRDWLSLGLAPSFAERLAKLVRGGWRFAVGESEGGQTQFWHGLSGDNKIADTLEEAVEVAERGGGCE